MPFRFTALDSLRQDARAVGAVLRPVSPLLAISLEFADGQSIPVSIACGEPPRFEIESPPSASAAPEFRPTAAQWKMIRALAGGKKLTKKQLANVASDKVYLRANGGLDEMQRAGVVESPSGGYELTDFGNAILAEAAEED